MLTRPLSPQFVAVRYLLLDVGYTRALMESSDLEEIAGVAPMGNVVLVGWGPVTF